MSEKQTSTEEITAYLAECRELPGYTFDRAVAIWDKAYGSTFWVGQKPSPRLPEARSVEVRFFLEGRMQRDLFPYMPLFFRFVEDPSTARTFIDAEWHAAHPQNMTFIRDGLDANASSYLDLTPLQQSAEELAAGRDIEKARQTIDTSVHAVMDDHPAQLSEAILLMLKAGLPIETIVDVLKNHPDTFLSYPTLTEAMLSGRIADAVIVKALESAMGAFLKDSEVVGQLMQGLGKMGLFGPDRPLAALKAAGWDESRIQAATSWLKQGP